MFVFDYASPRRPRAWAGFINPFMCFEGEPSPPPPPGSPPPPPPAPPPPPPAPRPQDPPRGDETHALRAEAAGYRIQARDAREALERETARVAEVERVANERVAAETARAQTVATKIKSRAIDAELRASAAAAGLRDLDLIPMIDRSAVVCDDEGNVTGAAEAVEKYKVKKPEYFQPAAPAPRPGERVDVRSGNPAPPQPPPGTNATPPGADVRTMPKADYGTAKRAALASLSRR